MRIRCEDGEDAADEPDDGTGAVGADGDVGAGWEGGGIGLGLGCCARTEEHTSRVTAIATIAAADADNANDLFTGVTNESFVAISFPQLLLTDYQVGSVEITARAAAVPENAIDH